MDVPVEIVVAMVLAASGLGSGGAVAAQRWRNGNGRSSGKNSIRPSSRDDLLEEVKSVKNRLVTIQETIGRTDDNGAPLTYCRNREGDRLLRDILETLKRQESQRSTEIQQLKDLTAAVRELSEKILTGRAEMGSSPGIR